MNLAVSNSCAVVAGVPAGRIECDGAREQAERAAGRVCEGEAGK
jgi:hypothetical protein